MSKILIKNGRVWDGEKFLFADILADGNKITRIEPSVSENAEFVFDASGKTVSPGFVDIHMHMGMISPPEFAINAELSSFPFGVTAGVDAGGKLGDEFLLNSFSLKNLVFVCAEVRDGKACFKNAEKKLSDYGRKAIGIKAYIDAEASDKIDIGFLEKTISFAEKHNLIVMVHSTGSPIAMKEILLRLRPGDIFTHAYHGGVHSIAEDNYRSFEDARRRGVILDAGFAGHIHTDFGVLKEGIKRGLLPDTISTDITKFSAYKRGGRYGMTMCMTMARAAGMNEEDIFRCVTSFAAKAVGMESEWGHLAVGRCADMAVLEYADEGFELVDRAGNKLESEKGYRCVLTISDGEVLYRY